MVFKMHKNPWHLSSLMVYIQKDCYYCTHTCTHARTHTHTQGVYKRLLDDRSRVVCRYTSEQLINPYLNLGLNIQPFLKLHGYKTEVCYLGMRSTRLLEACPLPQESFTKKWIESETLNQISLNFNTHIYFYL